MAETAQELISSLDRKKAAELVYEFENSSREHWHFFPNWSGRKGIPLSQFSNNQKVIIKELLNLLLTSEAFQEQENIRLIHGLRKDLSDPNNPMNSIIYPFLAPHPQIQIGVGDSKDIIFPSIVLWLMANSSQSPHPSGVLHLFVQIIGMVIRLRYLKMNRNLAFH